MRRGAIRQIRWAEPPPRGFGGRFRGFINRVSARLAAFSAPADVALEQIAAAPSAGLAPVLDPRPSSAEDEAVALLRIAAEIEGALLVQYLYAAGSLLPGVTADVPGFNSQISSDDWTNLIRTIAKQEMGHLITVQNLLLSLGADPHVDRENFPLTSPLYPFPFSLQPLSQTSLAKYVCAEAPHQVADGDRVDYLDAVSKAGAVVGEVPRAGQIYERLFWLFQDSDTPQDPWPTLQNPFPTWDTWHVASAKVGQNQDRQATPAEWRGDDESVGPDTAIYILKVKDKPSARNAIFAVGQQGEGPIADPGVTHFDKFLGIYRAQRAILNQPGAPPFVRSQASDPKTGLSGGATITDPRTLAWAKLANTRYQMLLMDIALAVSTSTTGNAPSTTARRRDFYIWAFNEMLGCIRPLTAELAEMPLLSGAPPDQPRAAIPYELPNQSLPSTITEQLQYQRARLSESKQLRATIAATFNPTPNQQVILGAMNNFDTAMSQKLG
jgi:hypothetical protein